MKTHLFALAFALVANATANILIRAGMAGRRIDLAHPATALAAIVTSPLVVAGIILFALNVLSYAYVLSRIPLSLAYPVMTSLGFVIVVGASAMFLGESIDRVQIGGMVLIVAGVIMVASRLG